MSISLSLYDIFSNAIPGLIYLLAFNEGLRVFGKPHLEIMQVSTPGQIIYILLVAFILGHLFTSFTYEKWYRVFIKTYSDKKALEKIQSRFPELKLTFRPVDAQILFSVIQFRSKDLTDRLESHQANAIMMRNISFGLFLIGLVELIKFFLTNYAIGFLATTLLCFIASRIAIYAAVQFYDWFYEEIFRLSSIYGNTYLDVIRKFRKDKIPKN